MLSRLLVPDTWSYMYAGYIVLTIILSGYVLSILFRWKKARKTYESYQEN